MTGVFISLADPADSEPPGCGTGQVQLHNWTKRTLWTHSWGPIPAFQIQVARVQSDTRRYCQDFTAPDIAPAQRGESKGHEHSRYS